MPSFDEAVAQLLGLLGASTGLLLLAKLAFAVQSWFQGIRQVATGARATGRAAVGVGRSLLRSPVRPLIALLVTAAVVAVQVYVLGTWYFFGNMASILLGGDRQRQRVAGVAFGGNFWQPSGWDLRAIYDVFAVDLPVAALLLTGCLIVAKTYSTAIRGRLAYGGRSIEDGGFWVGALALPSLFVLGPAFPFSVIAVVFLVAKVWGVVVTRDQGESWSDVAAEWNDWGAWIVLTLLMIVNFLLCSAAVRGSVAIARIWRPPRG